jgi:hypothetical protein
MTNTNKNCPNGYIKRKGYTRKYTSNVKNLGFTVRRKGKTFVVHPKASAMYVKPACIKNRGLPGKGPREGEGIGKLRKGELIKYGYQYRLSDALRHAALKRAIERYGALSVYRKLDAVAKYSVRTAPDASAIFTRDRAWVQSHYVLKKNT